MKVQIITPDKNVFSGEMQLAQFPGLDGSFAVMDRHAPMISALKKGRIKLKDYRNEEKFFNIRGGVVEVNNNNVLVLAE